MAEGGNDATAPVDLGIPGVGLATLVGRGGSGSVYRAQQPHLDRDVAVKIVQAHGDASVIRRFERERKAMGRLSQVDGVLPVHDAGVTSGGDLYLITPFMTAGSLQDRVNQYGPMPWNEAVAAVIPIARALHAGHQQGILHRDVKPANILLDDLGRPVLADFGIAKLSAETTTATVSAISLTPAYSAPEAFEDNDGSVAIDVYSLGATLWSLIAGYAPFTDTEGATPLGALIGRIMASPVGDLRGHAPEQVVQVIEAAMAKEPAGRPQSAADLAALLEAAMAGTAPPANAGATAIVTPPPDPGATAVVTPPATLTGPPPLTSPGASQGRRVPVVALVFGLLVVAGAAAAFFFLTGDDDEPTPAEVATAPDPTPTPGDETRAQNDPAVPTATAAPASSAGGEPTPAPTPPTFNLQDAEVAAALTWLVNDSGIATDFQATGASPCSDPVVTGSHCYYGPIALVGSDETGVVFATDASTPQIGARLERSQDGWRVVERFDVPARAQEPWNQPTWYRAFLGEEDFVDQLVADRGFSDARSSPGLCPDPTGEVRRGTVQVNEGKTLNVRDWAGENNPIILELGPDFRPEVFIDQSRVVSGTEWHLVANPVPDHVQSFEPYPWGCGWVSGDFLAIDPPLQSGPTGSGLAQCSPNFSLVFGGRTSSGDFDVAVCARPNGRVEYVGVTVAAPDTDIRLAACELQPGVFIATNQGFEYRVTDGGTGPQSTLEVIDPQGAVALLDSFGIAEGNPRTDLNGC